MPELQRRLRSAGLALRTGRIVTRIRSVLPPVISGIASQYADYPIEDPSAFADFDVWVGQPLSLRRWLRPQVQFRVDDDLPFKPLPAGQAFPMLEWGLNWCVSSHCHQYLTLHAAVVERKGRALVLPAPPGSGKSTLCAGLVSAGWRLLSDELTLIDPASGRIVPLPRPISLKNQSIEAIQRFNRQAVLSAPVHDTIKGTVAHMRAPVESVLRADETALPGWIVLPRYVAGAAAHLEPLSKARAFMHLADNAFNYNVHGQRGFKTLAALVDACACYEFSYSALSDAAREFARLADADARAAP
jgi:HprK-related kinase A